MKPVVFLGPTLPRAIAARALDATFAPPAAMGDVYRAVRDGATCVALIDGYFEHRPSPWHKEFLFALERGVRVYGAASMGALRAAELAAFGMCGVGRVYEAFARGELTDDDEVAVVHGPEETGCAPLSDAMVNLRAGLALAVARGALQRALAEDASAHAKSLPYPERSWRVVLQHLARRGAPSATVGELRALVARERPDVKRDDALELLARLATGDDPPPPPLTFERTTFFHRMEEVLR